MRLFFPLLLLVSAGAAWPQSPAALPAGEGAQGPVLGLVRPPGSFRLDAANRRVEPVARQRP